MVLAVLDLSHFVDQAGLEPRDPPACLPSAGIKGVTTPSHPLPHPAEEELFDVKRNQLTWWCFPGKLYKLANWVQQEREQTRLALLVPFHAG